MNRRRQICEKQIDVTDKQLANCGDWFDFDKLKACLAIPRIGGILNGQWGVFLAIFGRDGPSFDINGNETLVTGAFWHSPFLNTMILMGFSLLLALLVAFPIGIYSAVKLHSKGDYFFSLVTFGGWRCRSSGWER